MSKKNVNKESCLVDKVIDQQTTISDYQKEDAYKTLDRTIFWLNSLDTKASYLLAFIGIIGTVLFTTNYFSAVNLKDWSCCNFALNLLFLLIILSFLVATFSLIWCIKPMIKNIKPQRVQEHTILFYGSISYMHGKMDEMKRVTDFSKETIIDDINNQAYICSVICIKKSRKIFIAWVSMIICLFIFAFFEILKHIIL
jgi:hypothetical protein